MTTIQATQSHVTLDGIPIHVYQSGMRSTAKSSCRTLFFIHGNAETLFNWQEVWELLPIDTRILAFDLPGQGYSDRNWNQEHSLSFLAELGAKILSHFHIDKAVWIGHSLGGGVSLRAAVDFPDMVEGLVVVTSVGAPIQRDSVKEGWGRLIPQRPTKWFDLFVRSSPGKALVRRIIANTVDIVTHPQKVDLENPLWKRDVELWSRPNHIVASAMDLRALLDSLDDLYPHYENIQAPCVIVSGRYDKLIPIEVGEMLHRRIPRGRHTIVDDGGHMLIRTHPDKVVEAIHDCLRQL